MRGHGEVDEARTRHGFDGRRRALGRLLTKDRGRASCALFCGPRRPEAGSRRALGELLRLVGQWVAAGYLAPRRATRAVATMYTAYAAADVLQLGWSRTLESGSWRRKPNATARRSIPDPPGVTARRGARMLPRNFGIGALSVQDIAARRIAAGGEDSLVITLGDAGGAAGVLAFSWGAHAPLRGRASHGCSARRAASASSPTERSAPVGGAGGPRCSPTRGARPGTPTCGEDCSPPCRATRSPPTRWPWGGAMSSSSPAPTRRRLDGAEG